MTFRMTPSPAQMSDETINQLVDRGFLADPANTLPPPPKEHPLATFLYRKFRPGSGTLTKIDAYKIGNELDRLFAIELQFKASREQEEPAPVERTLEVGAGHPEQPPERVPMPRSYDESEL